MEIAQLTVPRKLRPMYRRFFGGSGHKTSQLRNKCISVLVLLPPRNFAGFEIQSIVFDKSAQSI